MQGYQSVKRSLSVLDCGGIWTENSVSNTAEFPGASGSASSTTTGSESRLSGGVNIRTGFPRMLNSGFCSVPLGQRT